MDKKIEEMIALGAAYALNCKPCMEIHQRLAIEAGVTPEEMQDAIQGSKVVCGPELHAEIIVLDHVRAGCDREAIATSRGVRSAGLRKPQRGGQGTGKTDTGRFSQDSDR